MFSPGIWWSELRVTYLALSSSTPSRGPFVLFEVDDGRTACNEAVRP